jgi:hypothetical protein
MKVPAPKLHEPEARSGNTVHVAQKDGRMVSTSDHATDRFPVRVNHSIRDRSKRSLSTPP